MAKTILFAAALLLMGATAGNGIARYSAARHRHTRAVMALAQFHFDRLSAAAKSGQCSVFVAPAGAGASDIEVERSARPMLLLDVGVGTVGTVQRVLPGDRHGLAVR
jgi:hypothetical protein